MLLPAILLAVCLALLFQFFIRDHARYARFKLLTQTADRQGRFRAMVLKSFLLFSGTTVVSLALLGRMRTLIAEPIEFQPLSAWFAPLSAADPTLLIILACAVFVGIVLGFILRKVIQRRNKGKTVFIGDIQPMMPRNAAETWHTALLSLNAGLSEELFFRLLLPLLLANLTHRPALSFVIAGLIFGGVHFYQGKAGMAAATIIGFVLTAFYLLSGSIWVAAAIHAFIDLIGLVVRPVLLRRRAAETVNND
jgi:membrane protease YdiL (CAAX protease family)